MYSTLAVQIVVICLPGKQVKSKPTGQEHSSLGAGVLISAPQAQLSGGGGAA